MTTGCVAAPLSCCLESLKSRPLYKESILVQRTDVQPCYVTSAWCCFLRETFNQHVCPCSAPSGLYGSLSIL